MTATAAYAIDGRRVDRDSFYAAACDPARSVVVEACAGAGKTWMLVSRIVRALLAGTPPQQILAITFTRKAAGEMRQRLDEWLAEFAACDDAARAEQLQQRGLDAAAAAELAPRLGTLHEALLEQGRAVEIRTFHAWFAQLMRAAPIDLLASIGLDAGRELIEDIEPLAAELYRRFHAAVLADPALEQDYLALAREHGRTQLRKWLDAAWDKRVEVELADRAGTLELSVPPASPDGGDPAGHVRELRPLLARLAVAIGAPSTSAKSRKQGEVLADALAQGDDRLLLKGARKALLDGGGAVRTHLDAEGLHDAAAALDAIQAAVDQHDAYLSHLRMVRLSRALQGAYAALKRDRGLADMADLERVGLALLRDSALAGWVQQRLDAQVRQLLIDEFQDTSPLQWRALSAWLQSYAGAGGGGAAPSVFIVGDPKQSIYRFRRAEPRVFAAAARFVRDALDGALLECDHTRRNAPGIVAAVNHVFDAAQAQRRYDGFREHSTEVAVVDASEPLALALPSMPRPPRERAGANAEAPRVWRDSLTVARVEADEPFRRHEARQVALGIGSLVAAGVAAGDIMVLARQRVSLRHLSVELQARQLPHAAAEPVLLMEMPEVRDLVALLDALASPRHNLPLAQALKSALFGIDDEALLRLARSAKTRHSGRWWLALMEAGCDADARLARARLLLASWADAAQQLPPHDLLDRVLHDSDFIAAVGARVPAARRAAALAAIDALLALALELDGARYPTLYGFARALKRRGLKATLARPNDAVQLLTVHAAKGLEAPVVFLMDADSEARGAESMTLLVDWPVDVDAPRVCAFVAAESRCPPSLVPLLEQEIAARERESLNALYVAMTRAKQKLVVSRTEPHRESADAWWPLLEPYLTRWSPQVGAQRGGAADDSITVPTLPPWHDAPPARVRVDDRAARLGSALHRVLEWASGPAGGGAAALPALVHAATRQWLLDADAALALERHAAAILASPACRRFYDPAAFRWAANEVSLASPCGEPLRADRVVLFDRDSGSDQPDRPSWWLLDLKLHPAPQTEAQYLEQLRRYRDALRALQPDDIVRCAFISGDGVLIEPDLPP